MGIVSRYRKTCPVCGSEVQLNTVTHYLARDNGRVGFASAFASTDESKLYDAFDCKNCGCQIIVQERKRKFIPVSAEDLAGIKTKSMYNKEAKCEIDDGK